MPGHLASKEKVAFGASHFLNWWKKVCNIQVERRKKKDNLFKLTQRDDEDRKHF
jgi:hypothetical protein